MSGRVLFLQGAAWTVELARQASLGEFPVANAETLNFVAADQARDAGLKVKRGEFPHDDWLEGLRDLLGRYSDEDEAVRAAAAAELSNQLSERELLFGARQPVVASLPGTKAGWGEQL